MIHRRLQILAVSMCCAATSLVGCTSSPVDHAISIAAQAPGVSLLPGDITEGPYARLLYTGLIRFDAQGKLHHALAESIETTDDQHFTITLKQGEKFFDGTEIQARHFIKAWEYVVANRQENSQMFHLVKGFHEGAGNLPGLAQRSPYVFTVSLTQPDPRFQWRLAQPGFMPLPDAAYDDIAAFRRSPQANGPYVVAEHIRGKTLLLQPNTFALTPSNNEGLRFNFFNRPELVLEAFNQGRVDVVDMIPVHMLEEYPDPIVQESPAIVELSIHEQTPHFGGAEGRLRRQALSLALDRDDLAQFAMQNIVEPAEGFASPAIPGYSPGGYAVFTHDRNRARQLWQEADALYGQFQGELPVYYSFDSDARAWVEKAAKDFALTFGIKSFAAPWPDFETYRAHYHEQRLGGAYVTGWTLAYPSLVDYWEPNFASDGWGNDVGYSNTQVDEDLAEFEQLRDPELAAEIEESLATDLPAIPVFVRTVRVQFGSKLQDADLSWDGYPDYQALQRR
ncbi:ABC transporter substrate-binding protein [Corynebacterium sp. HS2168-gen11]|uniref:ABC transporter substrate-binding protein n=1 Tax=Corynebacterium sp. HS2168-gen11 TaxID=2974027 RepID=UPI00216B237D|nr:ABC transporter substrate-binding protein [Corynebacterium sp. HS2168-gen11]MCS4534858.1 ABC transporter substrate-binding protein [Corynebacterium sp. HS2168-gen11]